MMDERTGVEAPTGISETTTSERHYTIEKDDAFHLLQNARRRAVLRYLLEHDETERFRMRDVTEEVAAWEHDTTVTQLTSKERQRVYIALYQSHLPKLDAQDVIRYNQDRGFIEPTHLLDVFEPYLEDGLHADCDHLIGDYESQGEAGFTRTVRTLFES